MFKVLHLMYTPKGSATTYSKSCQLLKESLSESTRFLNQESQKITHTINHVI